MTAPLTRLALRTRWRLLDLQQRPSPTKLGAGPPVSAMGLIFPGPVGLAAGFDRHGKLLSHAGKLGLGAIEAGSVFAGMPSLVAPTPESRHVRHQPRRAPRPRLGKCGKLFHPGHAGTRQASQLFLPESRARLPVTGTPGSSCKQPAGQRCEAETAHGQTDPPLPRPHGGSTRLRGSGGKRIAGFSRVHGSARGTATSTSSGAPPGIALVSVGGIDTPEIALARRAAGADLVQIHRGMVHQGYSLVAAINRSWRSNKKKPADFDRRVCGNSDSET